VLVVLPDVNREPAISVAPVSPALAATPFFASVSNSSTTTAGTEADGTSSHLRLEGGSSSGGGDKGGDFFRVRVRDGGELTECLLDGVGARASCKRGKLSTLEAISQSLTSESLSIKENKSPSRAVNPSLKWHEGRSTNNHAHNNHYGDEYGEPKSRLR
jgi:hypothetical protein